MNGLELIAYKYDPKTKIYRGKVICQIDPLETKKNGRITYIIPGNSTDKIPPEPKDGFDIVWDDGAWVLCERPVEPEPPEPTEYEKVQERIAILKAEIDKVDYKQFKYLRGELTAEEWEEVKTYIQARTAEINKLEKVLINIEEYATVEEKE